MRINYIRIIRHEGKSTLCRLLFDYLYYYFCKSATTSPFNTVRVLDVGIFYRSPIFYAFKSLRETFYAKKHVILRVQNLQTRKIRFVVTDAVRLILFFNYPIEDTDDICTILNGNALNFNCHE